MLYRNLAKCYTRTFWVITGSLSSWCPKKFESKSAQRNYMKSCETEQFADAYLSVENFWVSLELALCATALILCADRSLRSHDLTGRKILSFPECRLISLSPSQMQKVSGFSCWHHDLKTNAEIKDSLKINPHHVPSHVCVLLHPVSNGPVFVLLLHLARLTGSSGLPLGNPQHTVFVSDALHYQRGQCWHWNKLDWQD